MLLPDVTSTGSNFSAGIFFPIGIVESSRTPLRSGVLLTPELLRGDPSDEPPTDTLRDPSTDPLTGAIGTNDMDAPPSTGDLTDCTDPGGLLNAGGACGLTGAILIPLASMGSQWCDVTVREWSQRTWTVGPHVVKTVPWW
eukprot:TRINITY_DN8557_c1_g1_i1.p2 TRINITY_DN8557_c1_g1~~TRINITY_DN8557_c1_g1_i1.p2  ORF type:complete len:141 (-),score=5.45 TRINITY_DN8557_c1_g1_i1:219-641(-)